VPVDSSEERASREDADEIIANYSSDPEGSHLNLVPPLSLPLSTPPPPPLPHSPPHLISGGPPRKSSLHAIAEGAVRTLLGGVMDGSDPQPLVVF